MSAELPPSIHPYGLLDAGSARTEGWSGRLQGAARRGEVVKVRPGVYMPASQWQALVPTERYRARIHAARLACAGPVFSHQSAAAVHGLPLLDSRLQRLHTLQMTPSGSGNRGDITVHAFSGDPDIVAREGLRLTGPARTVTDLARTLPHGEALAVADAAIRPISEDGVRRAPGAPLCSRRELLDRARDGISGRNGWAGYLVAHEADPLAGSLGESMARSLMLRLGAPRPVLQTPHRDASGLIGYSDFWWPEHGVLGEFDGRLKYGADNPSGRRPEDVVYREKVREDRLRRIAHRFVRFGWSDLQDPPHFARLLRDAGLPLEPAAAWPALRGAVRTAMAESRSSRRL